MAPEFQKTTENELQQGSWELATHIFSSPPGPAYDTNEGAGCSQGAGAAGAAAEDAGGGALLDLAHAGLFSMMENLADDSVLELVSKPFDFCVQQSVHYRHGGEERRQMNSAAPPPQPPRKANQLQTYITPTSRQLSRSVPSSPTFQLSRSVPSSPTFATTRLHLNPAMIGGGGSGAPAMRAGLGNVVPILARNLSAYMNSSQPASSSASALTTSLDLASCTSTLIPPSPGSLRSASFSSDHSAAATASSFSNDHAAKSVSFGTDKLGAPPKTANFLNSTEHLPRSASFGSDQAKPASFSGDQALRSANFSSELVAAASFFLPNFFPSTPASSTSSQNPTAAGAEQQDDHQVQGAAAGSYTANNVQGGAKRRRLQAAGVKGLKAGPKAGGGEAEGASPVLLLNTQGSADVDIAPVEAELSNNSANIEGEESTIKGNDSGTSSFTCVKTQVCEGPPPPKQDYIHVRARRGQATDSHSLAERVRREKISERMKFLQDLVPGCNKITGKAVMLDEIINYVQSLQRQVEFLSMKLSAVSPQINKFEASHLINHVDPKSAKIGATLHFNQLENHHNQQDLHLSMPLLSTTQQQQISPQHQLQPPSNMGAHQAWDDELQSLVQMGFSTLP